MKLYLDVLSYNVLTRTTQEDYISYFSVAQLNTESKIFFSYFDVFVWLVS